MTIQYMGKNYTMKGRDEGLGNESPMAYISYDEYSEKECQLADKTFSILREKGWELCEEEGCCSINVWDRDEYKDFVEDYKEAKKMARRA